MTTSASQRVEQQLIAVLRAQGNLSRADLARIAGLPRSTVADGLARLRATGAVEESTEAAGARKAGRPASLVRLRGQDDLVAAVALTHQSLRIGLLDGAGRLLHADSFDARRGELAGDLAPPLAEFITSCTAALHTSERRLSLVVLGLPTTVETAPSPHRVSATMHPEARAESRRARWGADPAGSLGRALGVPVLLENDANLGALGEHAYGAARGFDHCIYIKAVDGLGAGIILSGRLHRGHEGVAGELIHLHVRDDGPVCICGGRGCLATEYSSPRLLLDLLQPAHDTELEFADVVRLAREGDAGVQRLLRDLGRTLGRSLADVSVYLGLQAVILDSTLGQGGSALREGMVESLARCLPPRALDRLAILHGTLGRDAELMGAAAVAREHVRSQAVGVAARA